MPGIQLVGGASGVTADVDTNTRALRVSQRPSDPLTLGSYCVYFQSGTMSAGLAANSPIFSFRWADSTRLAVLRSVRFGMTENTLGFTRGIATVSAIICRAYTVSPTGGQAVDMTGNNSKKRTSFGTSLISGSSGDIRGSQTAALTSGTRTPDSVPFGGLVAVVGSTGGALQSPVATQYVVIPPSTPLWQRDTGDEYPFVLAQNEGYEIRTTVPATGTWTFSTSVEWLETAAFCFLVGLLSIVERLLAYAMAFRA